MLFACSEELNDFDLKLEEQNQTEELSEIESLELHNDKTHYVYGDLLLSEEQANILLQNQQNTKAATSRFFTKWPNCKVPYKWSTSNPPSSNVKNKFIKIFKEVENMTSVDFYYAPSTAPRSSYLEVKEISSGAYATPGKVRRSVIELSWTSTDRDVRHEIGHVLGLVHEHQRADAENHIEFQWDNFVSGGNCQKRFWEPKSFYNSFKTAFDWKSVMIYHSCACSGDIGNNGCSRDNAVYVRLDPEVPVNTNLNFAQFYSDDDVIALNSIYKCSGGNPPGGGGNQE